MRVLVTGASGWIGSAVVPELIDAGHSVTGLARSDASAAALAAAGVTVRRGTIDDLDVLRDAATAADGVIHLAFKHDIAFSGDFEGAASADRRVVETFGDALTGSGKPFLLASGTALLAPGQVATELDGHDAGSLARLPAGPSLRASTAIAALGFSARGIRSCLLRFAPTVHGDGDKGFMAAIVSVARAKAVSAYIGDGANRWNAVHRMDAAHLVRLALERAPAGSAVHAVGDEGVRIRDVAEVIGRHLDVPVVSIAPEEAGQHFGWLAPFIAADIPASSTITRERLGWQPTHPGLLEDLEKGHYFGQ